MKTVKDRRCPESAREKRGEKTEIVMVDCLRDLECEVEEWRKEQQTE